MSGPVRSGGTATGAAPSRPGTGRTHESGTGSGTRFATPRAFSDCVHCGLCLSACPTYLEVGQEPDSPRGRIYLMKALAEGRLEPEPEVTRHIDLCLGCRACETACPSGVSYGHLLEETRAWLDAEARRGAAPLSGRRGPARLASGLFRDVVLGHVMTDPGLFRLAIEATRAVSRLGLGGLTKPLMPEGFDAAGWSGVLAPRKRTTLPVTIPAVPPVRGRVALLTGCVMDGLFGEVNAATARVLAREGWEVRVPRGQVCCGALTVHAGLAGRTREMVRENCSVFDREAVDFIVTNAAGCGAAMKEYGGLMAGTDVEESARKIASMARDVSEVLGMHPLRGRSRSKEPHCPTTTQHGHCGAMAVCYHDACHLAHGQKVTAAPRALLEQIEGLTLLPLPESDVCCGSAGSYNITEPEMAARLGARKASNIRSTGAEIVVAGNMGCLVQIEASLKSLDSMEAGSRPRAVHLVTVLDEAMGGEG